ncbi:unnamed protein product [Nippostrongylus brasiliensis]|uniref:Sushi domain-containing protein n=1 Tax=Nippostrongylus brasiliensis TaxID=27835 RepID=A0A0N4Y0F8_NIPBR|nr:unnamed protein product [Nippostrongylus brasiliensis]
MIVLFILCGAVGVASLFCPHPFIPENGHVVFDAPAPYLPNTVAKYSCATGFEKVGGTDERICSTTGQWNGEAPVCAIDVAAGKPALQQCDASGYSFMENATVYINCELSQVQKVRIVAEYRLHLCEARVYATNAGILWLFFNDS